MKYILDQKLVVGIQYKLLIKLLGYNYTVEYKKGKENKVADALSRAPHAEVIAISCVVPVWIELVTASYTEDVKCLDLITKLSIDNTAVLNFSLHNGILRHKGKIVIGEDGHLKQ